MIIRRTYFLILLCMCAMLTHAKPQYVFQTENPIANFAWDENDTSRMVTHLLKLAQNREAFPISEIIIRKQEYNPINLHLYNTTSNIF